jgi:HAD superfamily hydrolase (TIGR01509 family)
MQTSLRHTHKAPLRVIFWDNDGVLVDTEEIYFEVCHIILAEVGINLTEAMYRELVLVKANSVMNLAVQAGIAKPLVDELRVRRDNLYAKWIRERDVLIPGVSDVLAILGKSYTLGVVTSSLRKHFDIIHSRTGLLPHFAFCVTGDDVRKTKPDPEVYLRALERSSAKAEECIAIEDSARGLASALGAGLRCIVVPTAMTRASSFDGAEAVIDSVSELPGLLRAR